MNVVNKELRCPDCHSYSIEYAKFKRIYFCTWRNCLWSGTLSEIELAEHPKINNFKEAFLTPKGK